MSAHQALRTPHAALRTFARTFARTIALPSTSPGIR